MSTEAPNLTFNPLSPEFVTDPYPIYAALREQDPVHRSVMGYWVITRYEDVLSIMKDIRFSNEPSYYAVTNRRNRDKYVAADVANNIIPFMDPPAHTRSRKLISKVFVRHLKSMPFNIRSYCDALLDKHAGRGEMDILKDYATPLSVRTIGQLLGVPAEDDDKLKVWSEWFFYLFNTIPSTQVLDELNVALAEFRDYVARLVKIRRRHPEDDLITGLLNAEEDGYKLAEMELIDTIMLLFADGVENVDRGIANCVALLMEHPQVYRQIEARPELIPGVVEEALRINPPGQFIAKIASEDIEFHGRTIRQNEAVLLVLASANRDRTVFDRPDDFDHMRSENKHLGLGKGRHACIGAPMAKMVMKISLESMLSRIHKPSLANKELVWEARIGHRWLENLLIQF